MQTNIINELNSDNNKMANAIKTLEDQNCKLMVFKKNIFL